MPLPEFEGKTGTRDRGHADLGLRGDKSPSNSDGRTSAARSAPRLRQTHAVTTLHRHVFGVAERQPDVARLISAGDGRVGRHIAERREHGVAGHDPAVALSELVDHRPGEFTLAHRSRLPALWEVSRRILKFDSARANPRA